jgi:hypothetical protein
MPDCPSANRKKKERKKERKKFIHESASLRQDLVRRTIWRASLTGPPGTTRIPQQNKTDLPNSRGRHRISNLSFVRLIRVNQEFSGAQEENRPKNCRKVSGALFGEREK